MSYAPGQIVLVDWRDGLPKEPNKIRPTVVIEDRGLFDDAYPNLILVPLAEDPHVVIEALSIRIPPTPENAYSISSPKRAVRNGRLRRSTWSVTQWTERRACSRTNRGGS